MQKIDHDGFGIFAEQAEEPALDPLLQTRDLANQRTRAGGGGRDARRAQVTRRVAVVIDESSRMSGETSACMAP